MTSENRVPSISDIHSEFKLSDFSREWHNKRTKLSRQFWSLVVHTFYRPVDIHPVQPGFITRSYMNLFYRPTEIHHLICEHYEGFSTNQLKKELDFPTEKQNFVNKCAIDANDLLRPLQQVKFKANPTKAFFDVDISEFDAHHPYLEQVSDCFIAVMNFGEFRYLESMVYTLPFDLPPKTCRQLDSLADALIRSELFYSALDEIEHALNYMSTFNLKILVDGPTEALRHAMSAHPDLLKYPDQRIRYELSIKYTFWIEDQTDNTLWELQHFLHLATYCNPTILEVFKCPVQEITEEGKELLSLFGSIWTPKRVQDAFIGYGLNQRKKMLEEKDKRPNKYATAYLRTLYSAWELLTKGTFNYRVADSPVGDTLKRFKSGDFTPGEVIDVCKKWEEKVRKAYSECKQPNQPNYEKINNFIEKVRLTHFDVY